MTYNPKAGDTFLIDSSPSGKHLFVLLNNGPGEQHILVSVTPITEKGARDATCVITRGDHPQIRRPSFVYYRQPLQVSTARLRLNVDTGFYEQREAVTDALLARIRNGVLVSTQTPRWAQTLWRTGVGVDEQSSVEVAGQYRWATPTAPTPTEADTKSGRKLRAFLCHAKEDKAKTLDLYHELEKANLDPWIDIYNIIPGQKWEEEIAKSIRSTDAFLACLSKKSTSKTGYVQAEIKRALDIADRQPEGKIFIIPVLFEDCDVPERLRSIQYVDYFGIDGHRMLLVALRHLAGWLNENGSVVLNVL